jgi:hypothetical protein
MNSIGQTMYETNNTLALNTGNLAPGFYFILIEADEGYFVETVIKK